MDITGINSALSAVTTSDPASLGNFVGLKMLDNALDLNETMNEGLTKMMELSVNPHIGSNIDVSV